MKIRRPTMSSPAYLRGSLPLKTADEDDMIMHKELLKGNKAEKKMQESRPIMRSVQKTCYTVMRSLNNFKEYNIKTTECNRRETISTAEERHG